MGLESILKTMEISIIIKNAVRVNHALVNLPFEDFEFSCGEMEDHALSAMAAWYHLALSYNVGDPINVLGLSGSERDLVREVHSDMLLTDRFQTKLALCRNYIDRKLGML